MSGYKKTNWDNDVAPPLNAGNLNQIEDALEAALGFSGVDAIRGIGSKSSYLRVVRDSVTGIFYKFDPTSSLADDGVGVLNPFSPDLIGRYLRYEQWKTAEEIDGEFCKLFSNLSGVYATQDQLDEAVNLMLESQAVSAVSSSTDNQVITGADYDMSAVNNWSAFIGIPFVEVASGAMKVTFAAGANQAISLPTESLKVGGIYDVSVTASLISGGASVQVQFGSSFAGNVDIDASLVFEVSSDEVKTYKARITATSENIYIGSAAAGNSGGIVSFDNASIREVSTTTLSVESLIDSYYSMLSDNLLNKNDEAMSSASQWLPQIGAPQFDYSNEVTSVSFLPASLNKSVYIPDVLEVGVEYSVSIVCEHLSGGVSQFSAGEFSTGPNGKFLFTPVVDSHTYEGSFIATTTYFSIGVVAADNSGAIVQFEKIEIVKVVEDVISDPVLNYNDGGVGSFLLSLSKYEKPLVKLCVAGDSLMANAVGGAVPLDLDEGDYNRPIRLGVNSVARQIYDHVSFNKAIHRRLDSPDWVKSGLWSGVNDATVWEPQHFNTKYHESVVANSYVEITVPDGSENFALILQNDQGFGDISVTLNGGDISAFGNSVISSHRTRTAVGDTGNPYHTEEYVNLPAGDNTIRFSKQADTDPVRIWGGFYWSGVTLVVHNIAHGGHSLQDLISQHLTAELVENDFDAVLFEITIMNEMSKGRTAAQTVSDLSAIVHELIPDKDVMFMTPNPFGDNGLGVNYYLNYSSPSMEDTSDACVAFLSQNKIPYINVFNVFKTKVISRGGTLDGGQAGLFYTTDGQHPSVEGCREWFNIIRWAFDNKPITYK